MNVAAFVVGSDYDGNVDFVVVIFGSEHLIEQLNFAI